MPADDHELAFPRHSARTQRFTLGAPKAFRVTPDGSTVLFVRSTSGTDRVGRLWALDVATGVERVVADPVDVLGGADEDLSPEERSRRERLREASSGVTAYELDRAGAIASFALAGGVFVADGSGTQRLSQGGDAIDPRIDPTGTRVAYATTGGALRVVEVDGSGERDLVAEVGVSWGVAEFAAAEELGRLRGFWWSPGGDRLLMARVDESAVAVWHTADAAHPERPAVEQRYPAAGTANADVSLWLVDLDGNRRQVAWDHDDFPYLVNVAWEEGRPPIAQVMSRRQDHARVVSIDPDSGATSILREVRDEAWVDVIPGIPTWTRDGRVLTVENIDDRFALCADGAPLTPAGMHVRAVRDVTDDGVLVVAHEDDATQRHLCLVGEDGRVTRLTSDAGVHDGRAAGGTTVRTSAALSRAGSTTVVVASDRREIDVPSYAESPALTPAVSLLRTGPHAAHTAVLLPTGWQPGSGRLPVVMDPYGGPHGARVLQTQAAFWSAQWLADQGFAVVVADNRGMPREPSFERAVRLDLARPVLEDQVAALEAAAQRFPDLDLDRVGIRGWSFGGFLAALAVLDRPDVFHVAVAGAPVTEWRLYDTAYTERYLGLPQEHAEAYDACSLLPRAGKLERPLLLIHGLADDNVVAAHTLRLSSELLAAGRRHVVLPLSGVTHMTPQEVVAENLLLLQVDFLRQHLGGPEFVHDHENG